MQVPLKSNFIFFLNFKISQFDWPIIIGLIELSSAILEMVLNFFVEP
jgi:uncharacterized membrane protein